MDKQDCAKKITMTKPEAVNKHKHLTKVLKTGKGLKAEYKIARKMPVLPARKGHAKDVRRLEDEGLVWGRKMSKEDFNKKWNK